MPVPASYVQDILKLLVQQFKHAPDPATDKGIYESDYTDLQKLIIAVSNQLKELEEVYEDLTLNVWIDNASGNTLDIIGVIVDEPRQGKTDTNYKLALKFKAAANTSQANEESISTLLAYLTNATDVQLLELFPAKIQLQTNGDYIPSNLKANIEKIVAAGVGIDILSVGSTPFAFADESAAAGSKILDFLNNDNTTNDQESIAIDGTNKIVFACDGTFYTSVFTDTAIAAADSDLQAGGYAENVVLDIANKLAFIANSNNGIDSYSYDASGNLTHADNDRQGSINYNNLVIDTANNMIFAVSVSGDDSVLSYTYDAAGNLTYVDTLSVSGPLASGLNIDTTNQIVFVGSFDFSGLKINAISYDGSANLTLADSDVDTSNSSSSCRSIAVDITDRVAFISGYAGMRAYSYTAGGTLTQGTIISPGNRVHYTIKLDTTKNIAFWAESQDLRTFTYNSAASVTQVEIDNSFDVQDIDIDTANQRLVAAHTTDGVRFFTYDDSGNLTATNIIDKGGDVERVIIDSTNEKVFTGNDGRGIDFFDIVDGIATLSNSLTMRTNLTPESDDGRFSVIDKTNQLVFTLWETAGIHSHAYNDIGILTAVDNDYQSGGNYKQLSIDLDNRVLFIADSAGYIIVYSYDTSGNLTFVERTQPTSATSVYYTTVDSANQIVFCWANNGLFSFTYSTAGALTSADSVADTGSYAINVDTTNLRVVAYNGGAGEVIIYSYDASGNLSELDDVTLVSSGTGNGWYENIVFDIGNKLVVVTTQYSSVEIVSYDSDTLVSKSRLTGSPNGTGQGLAIDTDNQIVFSSRWEQFGSIYGEVSSWSYTDEGIATLVDYWTSTAGTDHDLRNIVIDVNNKRLFVCTRDDNGGVYYFSYDSAGNLSFLDEYYDVVFEDVYHGVVDEEKQILICTEDDNGALYSFVYNEYTSNTITFSDPATGGGFAELGYADNGSISELIP